VDPLSVLIGWGEKVFGAFRQSARADLRIADQARLLRRQLAASVDDWPQGPTTDAELRRWANNAARGFKVTEQTLQEIVTLRPEASRRVRRAVGTARDDYYAAADLISPTIQTGWLIKDNQPPPDPAPLRKAFAHFKRCIAALDAVVATQD
jgi:hypothetical protein